MRHSLLILLCLFSYSALAQVKTLRDIESKIKINRYNLSKLKKVESACGAKVKNINKTFEFEAASKALITNNLCKGEFWMSPLSPLMNLPLKDFIYPYEFEVKFTPYKEGTEKATKYLFQVFLGNSTLGYTWLGFDKTGRLLLSTRTKAGFNDILSIRKADKVHFGKENHIRFVRFPNGVFYIKLNSYEKWSYQLPKKPIIKMAGYDNRIMYYANLRISQLDINIYQ